MPSDTMPPSPTSTHVPTPSGSLSEHPQHATTKTAYPPSTEKPASSYTLKKTLFRRYVTPFENILNHPYSGSGTDADPYIVDWLPEDPEDPQRWSGTYKWFTIFVVAMATMIVALSSSAFSGGIPSLVVEFGASTELCTAGISLFVVGFAFGPLLWAPASELFGRRNVFLVSYAFLTLWTAVTCASQNIASVLVFRFFAGFFGSSPLSNAGGVISDVLDANQRGLGMAFFAAAPFLGPSLGPITGGFLGEAAGWRWVMGYLAIFAGVLTLLLLGFEAESYAPFLLRQRAARLSKATGKVYRFRADVKGILRMGPLFKASLIRPWKFLIFEPIVLILTLYTAVVYGILYLNFAAYPYVFVRVRGWSFGIGGLAFLGTLVGTLLAVLITIVYINPQYIKTAKKRGGRATPEDRLPPSIYGGVCIVIALAGFAATDGPDVHWIAPIIFGVPFGFGMVVMFLSVLGYLIDSYTIYAASVLAANSVLRSLFGAAFPLFTTDMYNALGIHWAAALPAFISLACIPFTILFYKYGAKIRAKCKYAADAERQMAALMAARQAQIAAQKKKEAGEEEAAVESGSTPTAPVTGAAAGGAGATGEGEKRVENEKGRETYPAQQEGGGPGVVGDNRLRKMNTREAHAHPAWDQYRELAERDEVDLEDDERMRLWELHETFDHRLKR